MRRFQDPTIGTFGLAVVLYTVLRIPSFFEPHWYTDEAGYATTAREMLRGKLLYTEIWNNKPPLQLWTVAAVLRVSSTEGAFHLATYLFGLLTLGAVAYAALHLLSRRRAILALLATAVLLGTPLLDAELLLPESLLVAPAAWAGALLLVRVGPKPAPGWRWPALVGVLTAAAIAYQQTSLADAGAFFVILLLSPRTSWRQALAYVGAFLAATTTWLLPTLVMAGPARVVYALGGFYISYTRAVLPAGWLGVLLLEGFLALAAVLALSGAAMLRRRDFPWALALWSVATLLAAAAAQHPYPHLLLPAMVPTVLLFASLRLPTERFLLSARRLRLGAAAMAGSVLIAAGVATVVGVDWVPPLASHGSNSNRTLSQYYVGLASVAAGSASLSDWRQGFDYRVGPDAQVAAWLKAHGLGHSKSVVWSSDAWPYLLADLDEVMPTPPIYNNFPLLGYNGEVGEYVRQQQPLVIVTSDADTAAYSEINPVLRDDYDQVFSAGPDHVWVLKGWTGGPSPE